jgi:hypothetical protein
MLSGLLLTADDHEFCTTDWAPGPGYPDSELSGGWCLIGCDACYEQDAQAYERIYTGTQYHWARRKDGRPLACSYFGAEDLRTEIQRQAEEVLRLREELASAKERLKLVRKGQVK